MDEGKSRKVKLTPNQARLKLESYCAYQERAQQEVRSKLYEYGLYPNEVEQIISELIENNFLNEERFAKAYVSGKFKIKKWGKLKIVQGLKFKQVSSPLIKLALKEIDLNEYYETLSAILTKKNNSLVESDPFKRKNKLAQYALSRGFESNLVWEILNNNAVD
ncbi:regulatory protein RecX [Sphingobacterium hungaricum]|uniref:Regulatory protein RecX n=1 Tax=Sphingobacterium hungaricum TaxID=2082723 RepID=A0A928UX10_9SPHI|nr:regulatory protein RecX [Sphingobacterium hungaricum]MBE8714856.1 RecX family transcriptional regulator [Sphingobacterium hungaricum]